MEKPGRSLLLLLAVLAVASRMGCAPPVAMPATATVPTRAPSDSRPWRASFAAATCDKLVPIPVSFAIPAGYLLRSGGLAPSAGCLWGTRADLDRGAAPDGFDFNGILQGVFWARVTLNVGYDAAGGQFSGGPGEPESALRKAAEGAGARIVRFARLEAAPRPALEMVAEMPDGQRVYMLYLAMGIEDNVVLINYHPPVQRTGADDRRWQEFLAGIKGASAEEPKH